jgi:AcrR family transcriptional regulator
MSVRADAVAATRERLLAAAWRHFATHPYEAVRLRDIATDADVSAQTLHAHFRSKDQLLTAAFLWWSQEVIAGRDAAPVGRVREAIRILYDHYEAHGTAVLIDHLRGSSRERRLAAIVVATDLLVWKLLRRDLHLNRDAAERIVAEMVQP